MSQENLYFYLFNFWGEICPDIETKTKKVTLFGQQSICDKLSTTTVGTR